MRTLRRGRGNLFGASEFEVLNVPRAYVYFTNATRVVNTGGAATAMIWDTTEYDTDGMFDLTGQPTRFTCRTAGLYACVGWVLWPFNAGNFRELFFWKNRVRTYNNNVVQPNGVTITGQFVSAQISMIAGDYIELTAAQNCGLNLTMLAATATAGDNGMQATLISTI